MKKLFEKFKNNERCQRIVDTIIGILIGYAIIAIGFKLIF